MRIEDQVCSFELSMKLKQLGIKQDSYFNWEKSVCDEEIFLYIFHKTPYSTENEYCSAFTVSELGELLPEKISALTASGNDKYINYFKGGNNYHFCELRFSSFSAFPTYSDPINEANVRASMLIYLLENKLMELPK